ncbi:Uncharacterized conserved protein YdeI, YjbR/CyaY-like superfamily, DUF1801 family [Catalinimonas alkaloidigena]|uniref:Uncharacterized conserved protein YdeI, YjbR/CyaY-like superfamily, DUF1801 family n=1 Tax=Catalinimonas alkaloidigena TaxID=1075417 RepID=A0A1G9SXH4_9BACT|nr:YdeI/OmpD-associated family protein [Catalinimonas alkaloidigena]SDM40102.1 Uncharacterized conserved protein YdeI, YjbR/CyaY-like superfamily, DUF1801 family [Catalinimonas alkaloidigena]
MPTQEPPVLQFANPQEFTTWLDAHHAVTPGGIWLRIAKKGAAIASVSYPEALDAALCYGWIDGLRRRYDADTFVQKFTPRRHRSLWSKVNREKVQTLIAQGRMQPAGLAAIEAAKQNGQWEAAYDSHRTATVPADFLAQLQTHPKAKAFFATLNRQNRYAVLHRIQTARKPETRARRIAQFVTMLERGETLYP